MNDISLMIEDFKFNYRVATIIKYEDKILLHKSKDDNFYAIPGGRIKIGEDSISALNREIFEEMNTKIIINKMVGIVENFFKYNDKQYHEIMLIYEANFKDMNFYNTEIIKGIEDNGKLQFVWKKIEDLEKLDIRPNNIKILLSNNQKEFFHIVDKHKLV